MRARSRGRDERHRAAGLRAGRGRAGAAPARWRGTEERLRGDRRRVTAPSSAVTRPARWPPAASGCGPVLVFLCGGSGRRPGGGRRGGRAAAHGDARARRRAGRGAAAPRACPRCSPPGAAGPPRPPATCCSRAPSPSWRPPAATPRSAALSRASSALARGELMQRADAWSGAVTRSATCSAASSRPRACSPPPAAWAPCSATRPRDGDGAGGLRPAARPGVPDPRRRARRVGPGGAHRQAPRHRPARRHGHAAAHPRPRARPRAGRAGPARGGVASPRRRRRCATGSRRPARWTRRASRR